MCIAFLNLGDPCWPVLIAANRDEFHRRPTKAAGPWPGHPRVWAGRDLQAGGTWLGCTQTGRYALLTNYREPSVTVPKGAPSRGALVRNYLLSETAPEQYLHALAADGLERAGFNLIAGTLTEGWYYSNRAKARTPQRLAPGTYVLSNHLLDTPWPKTQRLRTALSALPPEQWIRHPDQVFAILRDTTPARPEALPQTGLSPDLERLLSSPFIVSPEYGTRCSSVLALAAEGEALLCEQSYDAAGHATERHDWRTGPSVKMGAQ